MAVMVASPAVLALTLPSLLTLATRLLEELHVIVLSVALEGQTVAIVS